MAIVRVDLVWPLLERVWIFPDHRPEAAGECPAGSVGKSMTGAPGVRFFVAYKGDPFDGSALLVTHGKILARGSLGMQEARRAFQVAERLDPAPAAFEGAGAASRAYLRWATVDLDERELVGLAAGRVLETSAAGNRSLELIVGGDVIAQGETVDAGEVIFFHTTHVIVPHNVSERTP